MVTYAFLLIVLMLTRPQGLFGTHELWDLAFFKRFGRGRAAPAGAKEAP
jgi:branched-chain amino acid transport system permease protein